MTKSLLAIAVGAFLLAGTAFAGSVQAKTSKTGTATATKTTHHKSHKKHHSSKKTDMSQKAS